MAGLYIHIPFCASKCHYCGFYSIAEYSKSLAESYFDALKRDFYAKNKFSFQTIYIGGGTPSSVKPDLLRSFLSELFNKLTDMPAEFTIEANPESVTEVFLNTIASFNPTRLSIGCQSMDDKVLKMLNRPHTSDKFLKAYELIRLKLPNTALNLDMIYNIPGTSFQQTMDTAKKIVALSPEHISAYSYSDDTGYFKKLKDEDESLAELKAVRDFLISSNYEHYETSNFAKPNHQSLHNINYWQLGDYTGIGAAAYSLQNFPDKRVYKGKPADINEYINNPLSFSEESITDKEELIKESVVFGLRMTKGVDFKNLKEKYILADKEFYNKILNLVDGGFLQWDGDFLKTTEKGALLLDSLSKSLWC